MGDVTFVSNANVQPAMKSTTWAGYTNTYDKIRQGDDAGYLGVGTITNDDVWSAWVNRIDPEIAAHYTITWAEDVAGTTTEYSVPINRIYVKPDLGEIIAGIFFNDYDHLASTKGAANAQWLCAQLAYQVTAKENAASDHMMQATSLCGTNVDYGNASGDQRDGFQMGTSSVLGRYFFPALCE